MAKQTNLLTIIDQIDEPIFSNYYLAENEISLLGLVLISRIDDQLYFVKFFEKNKADQDVISYFKGNLQQNNADFDWISTKLLLKFLDTLLNKKLEISEVKSVTEMFLEKLDVVTIYKIKKDQFTNVQLIKELTKEDMLELVSKLIINNQTNQQLTDLDLVSDLADSQTYLLDSLFDNE